MSLCSRTRSPITTPRSSSSPASLLSPGLRPQCGGLVAPPPLSPRQLRRPALKASDIRAIAEELNSLMVELHEASRRIAAQVDNRATKLEILLQEADAKIARLEQLTGLSRCPPPAAPESFPRFQPPHRSHTSSPSSTPSRSHPPPPTRAHKSTASPTTAAPPAKSPNS